MAIVGQRLLQPENGYKRIENNSKYINYIGTWTQSSSGYSSGETEIYSTKSDDKIKFKFYGTKLNIIAWASSTSTNGVYSQSGVNVKIDNVNISNVNCAQSLSSIPSLDYSCPTVLIFSKSDLILGIHEVELTVLDKTLINNSRQTKFTFDAIDIDSNGYLLHPILNQVSDLSNMQIGDVISCRYTSNTSGQVGIFSELGNCAATEIPVISSANPDGLFYWIMTGYDKFGRMKLVADRNIQNSISWDTLNTAGICNELFIQQYSNNLIPIMTSENLPIGKVTASYNFVSYPPYMAFNKNLSDYWYNTGLPAWLSYEFANNTIVNRYDLTCSTQGPKDWTFEGYNGTTWEILDTRTGIIFVNNIKQIFEFENDKSFIKYRINITSGNGTAEIIIREFNMYQLDTNFNSYKTSIRLLTGGISNIDKDNEWDKIIVESTLNNTITAGDNNIWNWNGIYSWTSTTPSNVNTNRVIRGSSTVSNYSYVTSNTNQTNMGFRPMLLVEQLAINKYLISQDNKYYTINPELTLLDITDLSQENFNNYGFDDLSLITLNELPQLDKFKIYMYRK